MRRKWQRLIHSLRDNEKNKKTEQSKNNWLKVWKSWGFQRRFWKYEPEALEIIRFLVQISRGKLARGLPEIDSIAQA